jgi:hypothetical protein
MPGSFGPLAECRPGIARDEDYDYVAPAGAFENWICLVSHRWRGGLKSGARVAG